MMKKHIASLYLQCMSVIVRELHHTYSYQAHFHKNQHAQKLFWQLYHSRRFLPLFRRRILETLVKQYPSFLNDKLLEILCHEDTKQVHLQFCVNVSCNGLRKILRRCKRITSLDLSGCNQLLNDEIIALFISHGENIKTLKLNECQSLTDDLLRSILHHCQNIEELSCEDCDSLRDSVFANPLVATRSVGANLISVNLSSCMGISSTFIRCLTNITRSTLQSLDISWTKVDCISLLYLAGYTLCTAVEVAHGTESLGAHVLKDIEFARECMQEQKQKLVIMRGKKQSVNERQLCSYCTEKVMLKQTYCDDYDIVDPVDSSLALSVFEESYYEEKYNDWVILSLDADISEVKHDYCSCSEEVKNISVSNQRDHTEKVDFEKPTDISENVQLNKFQRLFIPNLTSLDISRIDFYDFDVGKRCLELFVESNPGLVSFHISWPQMDDEILGMVAKNEVNLSNISLTDSEQITSIGISTLASYCKHLKFLDIRGLAFVNDDSLIQLINNNPSLQFLGLAESPISDRGLLEVAEVLYSSISHLNLSWCENITDAPILRVLSQCNRLNFLNLRQCKISSPTIQAIIKHGVNITDLGLCGVNGLSDSNCRSLMRSLPNVRNVDLSWNLDIGDDTIKEMFYNCPRLRELKIHGLKKITSKPFLPIIPYYDQFHSSTVQVYLQSPEIILPFRSVNYAADLEQLKLGYCDKVNDNILSEIVAVCRGMLKIEGYFGEQIKPKWKLPHIECDAVINEDYS